ncbi:MAG: ribosome assembly cofactor RimP [Flavobacteriales bacterium]|nr:ribosome assembly cofactor RimP [Flavobacteriales bacterium]
MINKKVQLLIENYLSENEKIFLVSLNFSSSNHIEVLIDSFSGINISDCITLNRYIENGLNRDEEDFSLKVSSAGLTEPFKVFKQYEKNIGKKVKVQLNNGNVLKGKMVGADSKKGLLLEIKKREKIGKQKLVIKESLNINFKEISKTSIILSF